MNKKNILNKQLHYCQLTAAYYRVYFCAYHLSIFAILHNCDWLCCIATEKIWWLLTKFIINNHLTVEEKICHRK
ncbi:hypothetical protein ACJZL1_05375 [Wolbachia endosymbiont of Rhagoletis indifferens]|uniref:hypothetical protein n=1 Tax=Wolbachia endosymbiont of Rhagoletis indifferens TaxID=3383250 RepID=UPI003AF3E290